jgi:hypothetical protein
VVVTPQALVTLTDPDLFQVRAGGRPYRCPAGRPEYAPPELQRASGAEVDRQPEHDAFALAVLIFRLLMQGAHPFTVDGGEGGERDSIPARIAAGFWPYAWERPGPHLPSPHSPPWSVLPPAVQELLRCCFEDARENPTLRPSAARWRQALEEAENDLTTCPQNAQHRHARGLDVCPWCLLARQQGRDPFPARKHEGETREAAASASVHPSSLIPHPSQGPPAPPTAAVERRGWAEAGLGKVGGMVERHGWVAWFGAILVGTVAGMLWALERAGAPAATDQTRQLTAGRREANPAATSPPALLPGPVTTKGPALSPLAPLESGRPKGPVPVPPGSPLAGAGGRSPRKADQQLQEATYSYLGALQAYQEAVAGSLRGEVSQQEVNRLYGKVQEAQRKQQAGWKEVGDAISGHSANRTKDQKPSPP